MLRVRRMVSEDSVGQDPTFLLMTCTVRFSRASNDQRVRNGFSGFPAYGRILVT